MRLQGVKSLVLRGTGHHPPSPREFPPAHLHRGRGTSNKVCKTVPNHTFWHFVPENPVSRDPPPQVGHAWVGFRKKWFGGFGTESKCPLPRGVTGSPSESVPGALRDRPAALLLLTVHGVGPSGADGAKIRLHRPRPAGRCVTCQTYVPPPLLPGTLGPPEGGVWP